MSGLILSIYEMGNWFGYWACVVYILIMAIACVYVMRKYLREDD